MQTRSATRIRFIRFIAWALAMFGASLLMNIYSPRHMVFVPCFFMAMMVPAVLLPLRPRRNDPA
jgi:hypothetical protein